MRTFRIIYDTELPKADGGADLIPTQIMDFDGEDETHYQPVVLDMHRQMDEKVVCVQSVQSMEIEPVEPVMVSAELLKPLLVAAQDALYLTGLECNCGGKCEGTCTFAELSASLKAVKEAVVPPLRTL